MARSPGWSSFPANGLNSKVTISSLSGTVATAVRSIYFKFGAAENDYVGCHEIDVNGFINLPTGLATFRTATGLAADGSQDLLTPAGDGVENLLKYAFNMIGSGAGQGTTLAIPNSSVLASNSFAGLPFAAVDGSGKLEFTYIRRKASSNSGITYAVEFSDALASWGVNLSATESAVAIDGTFERVTVTDSASPTSRFVRVRVTAP